MAATPSSTFIVQTLTAPHVSIGELPSLDIDKKGMNININNGLVTVPFTGESANSNRAIRLTTHLHHLLYAPIGNMLYRPGSKTLTLMGAINAP
ncbi:hypothetical protein BDN67DRAFT_499898 [Paxillus ammoniavirescens]|nr:hypothetical protein BDN67DRAFT_499898 [Paxillus ammoniavirescens]